MSVGCNRNVAARLQLSANSFTLLSWHRSEKSLLKNFKFSMCEFRISNSKFKISMNLPHIYLASRSPAQAADARNGRDKIYSA